MKYINIEHYDGDIFSFSGDIICNAVNVIGVMGKGIALAFKNKFPEMFMQYREDCRSSKIKLTHATFYKSTDNKWKLICNVPTMFYPGEITNKNTLALCLKNFIDRIAKSFKQNEVVIVCPYLGCGIGRLKEDELIDIFKKLTYHSDNVDKITLKLIKYAKIS